EKSRMDEEREREREREEEEEKRGEEKGGRYSSRLHTPPVTFLGTSDSAPSRIPLPLFGYDDSLPHPNQSYCNAAAAAPPMLPPGLQFMHPPPP
ncbi:hypothetical protein PENTCL1PPCAC_28703, partial [Pristionchus entomophagus]